MLRDISFLVRFFLNDSLHGLFDHPFLQKKRNRLLLFVVGMVAYLGYFSMNMSEVTNLSVTVPGFSGESLTIARKTTLSSYYDMTLVLCGLIFVMVNSTATLARNAFFLAKTLPFQRSVVSASFKIFKLVLSFVIFNLFFIIVVPGLKLLNMPFGLSLLTLVSVQLMYIALYLLIDLLFGLIAKVPYRYQRTVLLSANIALIAVCMFHFARTRFTVDNVVSHTAFTLGQISMTMFLSSLLLLLILVVANLAFPSDDVVVARRHFLNVPIGLPVSVAKPLATVVRSRLFVSLCGIAFIMTASTMYYAGTYTALQNLIFILPMFGIVFLGYADATLSERPMFRHLRISADYETAMVVIIITILMLPSGALGIAMTGSLEPFFYGFSISVSSAMLGILFPKSKGSMNDTVSTILSIITICLLTLVINIKSVIYPITGILVIMLWQLITYETRTSK